MRRALCAVAAMVLAGCASDPRVMKLDGAEAKTALVFPAPQTQEVPRYRYVGALTGEANFQRAGGGRSGAREFLAWVAGLGLEDPNPVVLQRPQTGTVDAKGRVLVTDVSRNAVFVFDEAGGKLDVWERVTGSRRFRAPIGIAQGRGGEILVADAELGAVFRLAPDGSPVGEFGAGALQRPTGLARDAKLGRVYVADTRANAIKVFDDDGRLVATWGSAGDGAGEFNAPTHLALSGSTLIVGDTLNARVQALDVDGKPVLTFGRRGLYVGNMVRPKGVAADDEGNLYVVESMHDTLLVFDPSGQPLMSIGGTGQEAGNFYLPAGVWIDARNRVFVADMFNGRVAVFQFLGGN